MAPSSPLSGAYSLLLLAPQMPRQRLLHQIQARKWELADRLAIRSRQNRTELPVKAATGQTFWLPQDLRCASIRQLLLGKKGPSSLGRKRRFPAYLRQSARIQ